VEVEHRSGECVELQRVEVPRRGLKTALRGQTARELLPSLPEGVEPSLGITFSRQRYSRPGVWEVTIDRELTFSAGSALGTAVRRTDGVVITIDLVGEDLPAWLAQVATGLPSYHAYANGMAAIAAAQAPLSTAHSHLDQHTFDL
jgi:hypothetical protein